MVAIKTIDTMLLIFFSPLKIQAGKQPVSHPYPILSLQFLNQVLLK